MEAIRAVAKGLAEVAVVIATGAVVMAVTAGLTMVVLVAFFGW